MTTLWTSTEIAQACGVTTRADFKVTGISIDSRTVQQGDLFIAIRGDQFDGHDYAAKALEAGAACVLLSTLPPNVAEEKAILVKDTQAALVAMAKARREETLAKIIGVTGSVGKTGVKEMLVTLLQGAGLVHATIGNLNNHLGLPLTLARLPKQTDFAVLEMGMNHAGEIAYLTKIARPHVAIITAVEAVHIEFFDSVAGIADAKAEIMEGLVEGGTIALPLDSPHFLRLEKKAGELGLKIITFGVGQGADVRLENPLPPFAGGDVPSIPLLPLAGGGKEGGKLKNAKASQMPPPLSPPVNRGGGASPPASPTRNDVALSIKGKRHTFPFPLEGRHQAVNLCGALAVIDSLGVNLNSISERTGLLQPAKGRGQSREVKIAGKSVLLVDDSYNASPASMKAALETVAARARKEGRRVIAALGEMLELGNSSKMYHEALAEVIRKETIAGVITKGPLMRHLYNALPGPVRLGHADTLEAVVLLLEKTLAEGDLLLIKGSHGSEMWKLPERLGQIETSSPELRKQF